jgi:hypothetical protein
MRIANLYAIETERARAHALPDCQSFGEGGAYKNFAR